ncbi:MAG TPA: 30S ribosomal protein S7 [Syntrophaceae bacterium]|nr:30S ribosomal protein S7 [Syntrophaceae bacterium]
MPRKGSVPKREILPDTRYGSKLVARFINNIMRKGKKSVAERILYQSFNIIQKRTHNDPLKVFEKALDNVKPVLEVRPRRVGGATYQVPMEVRFERRISLGIRWLITYAKRRPEKGMENKLAGELIDAANNRGAAVKKKEDTHKMAEANKAFAHYRW